MSGLFIFVMVVALLSGGSRWLGAPRFVALAIPIIPLLVWLGHGLATGAIYLENGESIKIWEDAVTLIVVALPISTIVAFVVPKRRRKFKYAANSSGSGAKAEPGPARKIANPYWYPLWGIGALVFIWLVDSFDHIREPAKPFYTYYFMVDIAKGCEEYKSYVGDWPRSMSQMDYKFGGGPAKDAWNNEIIFVPYDDKTGYGELISYGRDGVPGGDGLDRDWILRFPIKENYSWDKMQATDATNIRGSTNYDWFDGSISGKSM